MRRKLWVITAIVVGLILASSLAYAGDRLISKPNAPNARLGQLYDRTNILRMDAGPVRLPRPVGDSASAMSLSSQASTAIAGPVAMSFDSPRLSGAMAQPRGGGSMYSGQQQADREIKKLIRRLN
jgi:hypothetical protein